MDVKVSAKVVRAVVKMAAKVVVVALAKEGVHQIVSCNVHLNVVENVQNLALLAAKRHVWELVEEDVVKVVVEIAQVIAQEPALADVDMVALVDVQVVPFMQHTTNSSYRI